MRPFEPVFFLFLLILAASSLAKQGREEAEDEEDGQSNSVVDHDEGDSFPLGEGDKPDLSHGFGTDIDWVGWPDAISIALDLNRPIFMLIHKTWCGACTALKKSFNTSNKRAELVELSKKFVMVNLEDDDEPEEDIYAPDGRYIPRLFILDKEGQPLAVDNRKNYPSNQQYFPQVPDVIRAMKQGLELFEGGGGQAEEPKAPKGPKETKAPKQPKDEAKKTTTKQTEEDMQKAEEQKKAGGGGGCPHAAGKAAKKAAEEEAKKKEAAAEGKKQTGKADEKKPTKKAQKSEEAGKGKEGKAGQKKQEAEEEAKIGTGGKKGGERKTKEEAGKDKAEQRKSKKKEGQGREEL